jgi:hypothetical protein
MSASRAAGRHTSTAAALLLLGACASLPRPGTAAVPMMTDPARDLGIEVVGLRLTAADAMLDFRFRVVDASLASRLAERGVRPYATVEETGARLPVPSSAKVGPLRSRGQLAIGPTYYVIFANPGRAVLRGDRLSITWGDAVLSGLTVR